MNHITRPLDYGPHVPYPVTAEVRGDLRRMIREQLGPEVTEVVNQAVAQFLLDNPPGQVTWGTLTGKPALFPPTQHSHTFASLTGRPTHYPTTLSQVEGLSAALNAKAEATRALPAGGSAGQVLMKSGAADFAAQWATVETGGGGGGGLLLDTDGVPYFVPGQGGIELDTDGVPYFTIGA